MEKTICNKCAEMLKEAYKVKKIKGRPDEKVQCENCGRRHYGGVFNVEKKVAEH